jgi:hypothetical protein
MLAKTFKFSDISFVPSEILDGNLFDSYLFLISSQSQVNCVFNEHNIWANIQSLDAPHQIQFDLSNSNRLLYSSYELSSSFDTSLFIDWRPFFGPKFTKPNLSTIQIENLLYTPPDFEKATELQV